MTLTAAFPAALWFALPALAVLLLFRLLRAKRRRVLAGSLLIWKRLAALPAATKPKRIVFDLSLFLQAAALVMLVVALADVRIATTNSTARTVLILVDNGPLSRARTPSGHPTFDAVRAASLNALESLSANDRVFVLRTSPTPTVLNAQPIFRADARALVDAITPALSGPDAASIWLFATDRARMLARDSAANIAIVSLQSKPPEALSNSVSWISLSGDASLPNVAIVEAGSAFVDSKTNGGSLILVRIGNFSDVKVDGRVVLESFDTSALKTLDEQPLTLEPNQQRAVGFRIAPNVKSNLRVTWRSSTNSPDAMPEDDTVVLAARPVHAPRIRFHAPHAALEKLFRLSLYAIVVSPDEKSAEPSDVDLDVYIGSVPERLPADSRAALLIAPERGYQSHFDVSDKLVAWPAIQRGDESPLNSGIATSAQSGIAIPKAFEILRTGDFLTLLRDAFGHALAARFIDDQSRPFYVLAFSPGDGLPPNRALDPALAAMLVRIALEASRAGPPYVHTTAADLERASNQPLPLDWNPSIVGASRTGSGVLNEAVSDFMPKHQAAAPVDSVTFSARAATQSQNGALDLTPWFCAIALLLATAEFYLSSDS